MKHHKGKHHKHGDHTAPAIHHDMASYRAHVGHHHDKHAHDSHHHHNKHFGMSEGLSPSGGYQEGPEGPNEECDS